MDFGVLSPEVNSGRMYAGPGAGPMLVAAGAWARLAGELVSAANGYAAVISRLTDEGWSGPAAESMAAAAAPYVGWLAATAVRAEQAAAQVAAAVSAFEEAYAAVVPPPVIAANRAQLASLVATNILGQNSAAIAATEAQYAAMWVQDAAVMYGYAGRSAAAAAVTPFSEPPVTTNPGGPAGQTSSVAEAGAGGVHNQLSQLLTAIPQALHGVSSTTGSPGALATTLEPVQSTTLPSLSQLASYATLLPRSIVPFNDALKTILYGMGQNARNMNIAADIFKAAPPSLGAGLSAATGAAATPGSTGLGGAGPVVSAGVGNAGTVGKLAVPPNWVEVAPVVKMTAAALPGTSAAAAPVIAGDLPTGIFADMALASLVGRAMTGSAPRARPASVMNGYAQSRLERMVTDLAGTHEVQHWHVDPSRLDDLLDELSEQPGVHAVHVNDDGTELKLPPQPG